MTQDDFYFIADMAKRLYQEPIIPALELAAKEALRQQVIGVGPVASYKRMEEALAVAKRAKELHQNGMNKSEPIDKVTQACLDVHFARLLS